ncbi:MAG: hypothetical protein JW839_00655 [Candidatus Lokiarchaeota archaeon]|nr:hypothetical protein [Candidatus Lokiarchaeota archaeon]
MKREARQFLESFKGDVDFLLIDGTLQIPDEKVCGCCGPPPSPDYKVQLFTKNDQQQEMIKEKTIEIEKIVKFKVSKQLYDAIVAARMNIVVFYLESTDEARIPSTLVAKFI